MKKKAIITGITGQDGSYLSEFLLEKDYNVLGLMRKSASPNLERIDHILDNDQFGLKEIDLSDQGSLIRVVKEYGPDEIYNIAAQSFVPASWDQPVYTGDITALGVTRMLETIRIINPDIKFYQASSSEMFGKVKEVPQTETTPFHPRSPYGVSKVYGHWITINYRESFNIFACSGILFNHESPRRGLEFVTRKVTYGAASIKLGLKKKLAMGNLEAERDWGFAGDYVEAMWLMLQHERPDDYVVGTGTSHSVEDLLRTAFNCIGLDYKEYVAVEKAFLRPAEVDRLLSGPDKARRVLKWEHKVGFEQLIEMMVKSDYDILRKKHG